MAMSPIVVASLSIKAIKAFLERKKVEELNKISVQNETIINQKRKELAFLAYQYRQQIVSKLSEANIFYNDSLWANNPAEKRKLLDKAFELYTSLCLMPVEEKLPDDTILQNDDYISYGYYGRFCYFAALNDFRNCAIQVYECAVRFPSNALELFDKSFFPQLDYSEFVDLCENLRRISNNDPLIGLYFNIPSNMAKSLIEMQLAKYKLHFENMLNTLKSQQYEQV